MTYDYDIIIIGGGPAGATCALYAAKAGLNILLIDKKTFPRDKICGDAISGKSITYLRELGLLSQLEQIPGRRVNSVLFSSPNGTQTQISFTPPNATRKSYGYVCRRQIFDNLLFQAAKQKVETREGFAVENILLENSQVCGVSGTDSNNKTMSYTARIVVGADGYHSILSRKLGLYELDPKHWVVATRAYYRGVKHLTDAIEIHFVKDILPGYFWIFPLEDGHANVGLGILHSKLKKRKMSLRKAHLAATESDYFRERFRAAELMGRIHGWNLPMGSKRRQIHGNGYILLGDAAGLIDPFSGEGIGNAICSAKIAAKVLAKVCKGKDYDATRLQEYADRLWTKIGNDLKVSYRLQRIGQIRPLVNLVVARAAAHQDVRDWISTMIAGSVTKGELTSPMTYLRLLFRPA